MEKSCEMTWKYACLVVGLSGEVDHHKAKTLREELDQEIRVGAQEHGSVDLIFDFKKVSFMDSSGIGVIMGRYNTVRETGGKVFVTGCDPYVDQILEMAGIYLITDRRTTLEEALEQCMRRD